MPSTNGHGPKRAVIYARVSTDEQARSGYSLAQQLEALLESWAGAVPEALDQLTGRERNKVYRMLRLEVKPTTGGFDVTGVLGDILHSETDTTAAALTPSAPPAASSIWRASPRR